jgi:hypothetical protein
MEKVIRNGQVAVLISGGFGVGWYTWNTEHEEILFHPKLVEMVEAGRQLEITDEWCDKNLGFTFYTGGNEGLKIEWVNEKTAFKVDEYDGAESLITSNDFNLIA